MADHAKFQAFTIKAPGRLDRIITTVAVSAGFDPAAPPTPLPTNLQTKALPRRDLALGLCASSEQMERGGGRRITSDIR